MDQSSDPSMGQRLIGGSELESSCCGRVRILHGPCRNPPPPLGPRRGCSDVQPAAGAAAPPPPPPRRIWCPLQPVGGAMGGAQGAGMVGRRASSWGGGGTPAIGLQGSPRRRQRQATPLRPAATPQKAVAPILSAANKVYGAALLCAQPLPTTIWPLQQGATANHDAS